MANRPLIAETKLAVGSLIPGVPFLVFDEQVYTGLTAAQVTALLTRNEIRGDHNVASDVVAGGLHTVTLHQIRIKNSGDAGFRPSWTSVDTAELNIQADNVAALAKQSATYDSFANPLTAILGTTLDSLTASQRRNLLSFYLYMGGKGINVNAKGRIVSLSPATKAPVEYHYVISFDSDDWLIVTENSQWTDFIS